MNCEGFLGLIFSENGTLYGVDIQIFKSMDIRSQDEMCVVDRLMHVKQVKQIRNLWIRTAD